MHQIESAFLSLKNGVNQSNIDLRGFQSFFFSGSLEITNRSIEIYGLISLSIFIFYNSERDQNIRRMQQRNSDSSVSKGKHQKPS